MDTSGLHQMFPHFDGRSRSIVGGISTEGDPDAPLLDTFIRRFGPTFLRSEQRKALAVQGSIAILCLLFLADLAIAGGWPFLGSNPSPEFINWVARATLSATVIWGLFGVVTAFRWTLPSMRGLAQLTAYMYALTAAGSAYVTGPFSSAGAFAILCGALVGLLLFGRRVMFISVMIFALALMAADTACAMGLLPLHEMFIAAGINPSDPNWILQNSVVPAMFGGAIVWVFSVVVDSWRYRERRIRRASHTDSLTGALNHARMMSLLDATIDRAAQRDELFAIVLVDLNSLGAVNDAHGRSMGDKLLRRVGSLLRACLRGTGVLVRVGGERFVLILPGANSEVAMLAAERASAALKALPPVDDVALSITPEIGVAEFPRDGENVDALLARVGERLDQVRDRGYDGVAWE